MKRRAVAEAEAVAVAVAVAAQAWPSQCKAEAMDNQQLTPSEITVNASLTHITQFGGG